MNIRPRHKIQGFEVEVVEVEVVEVEVEVTKSLALKRYFQLAESCY
jgi:hypothetical protein